MLLETLVIGGQVFFFESDKSFMVVRGKVNFMIK